MLHLHRDGPDDAETAVLLLHAGASSGAQWTGYARALGPNVRTVAPDLHGQGATPMPPDITADNAVDRLVDDLLRVMADAPRFHVVGHSYGGLIAVALAVRAPDRVLSLTAVEPAVFDALRVGGPQALYDASHLEVTELAARVDRGEHEQAIQQVLARWGMARWDLLSEPQRTTLVGLAPALLGIGLAAALRWRFDPERLAALTVPTLLVHGDRSPDVVLPVCEALRAAIPGARRVCIEAAGHMLPLTHRASLTKLLRQHHDVTHGPR